jgi:hypothetical protein
MTGVQFPAGARDFSLLHGVQDGTRAPQPPIQWVPRTLSLEVKWQRREADHLPPFSAEVKNVGVIPPLPHMSSWHIA